MQQSNNGQIQWYAADATAMLAIPVTSQDVGGVCLRADRPELWALVTASPAAWRLVSTPIISTAIFPGATPGGGAPDPGYGGAPGFGFTVNEPAWYDAAFSGGLWRAYGPKTCKLAADITTTGGALANATGMALPVRASTTYGFSFDVRFRTSNVAASIGLAIGTILGASMEYDIDIQTIMTGAAAPVSGSRRAANVAVTAAATDSTTANMRATVSGVFTTSTTTGNIQLRWLSSDGVSTITMKANSGGSLQILS